MYNATRPYRYPEVALPAWTLNYGLPALHLAALLAIAAHSRPDGLAVASYATLADTAGMGKTAVRKATIELADAGVITREHRYTDDGGHLSNGYRIAEYAPEGGR